MRRINVDKRKKRGKVLYLFKTRLKRPLSSICIFYVFKKVIKNEGLMGTNFGVDSLTRSCSPAMCSIFTRRFIVIFNTTGTFAFTGHWSLPGATSDLVHY